MTANNGRVLLKWPPLAIFASAVLLWLAFPPYHIGWLAWVALAPLALAVIRAPSLRNAIALGAVAGIVWILASLDWVRTAYPGAGGAPGPFFGTWLTLGVWGALATGATTGAVWVLVRSFNWPVAIALPMAWILGEEVRDYLCRWFAGTTGDMMRLAITQVKCLPALQSADLGGASVVGWFVVAGNGLAADVLRPQHHQAGVRQIHMAIALAVAVAVGAMFVYGRHRLIQNSTGVLTVGIVPKSLREYGEPQDYRRFQRCDLAVWPEHAVAELVDSLASAEVPRVLQNTAAAVGCPLLVGCDRISSNSGGVYNSVVLVTPDGTIAGFSDKRFLSPVEETTPLLASLLLPARAFAMTPYSAAEDVRVLALPAGQRIGVGICHDICYPEWGRDLCLSGSPDAFVNCASEGFDQTGRATAFMMACAQLRAVECRRAVVRCARAGPSAVVDSSGRVVELPLCDPPDGAAFEQAVPLDSRQSLFVAFGSSAALGVMLCIGCITHGLCRPRKLRRESC